MNRTQLVLVIVGLAALAGGGTALAAKGHSHAKRSATAVAPLGHHGPGDDFDAAASYLGMTAADMLTQLQSGKTLAEIAGSKTSGLIGALVTHEKQELADAVTAGRLTQAQVDQITPTLTQRFTDLVNGVRPPRASGFGPGFGPGFGHDHGPGGPGDDLATAATYLGTTTSALITQLQSGKTLAEIAGSKASGLVDALVAQEKHELADAVKAGKVTQAQADQMTPMLTQRVTDLVNGVRPPHDRHDGWGPSGRRA